MKCPHCGRESSGPYCPTCGAKLTPDEGSGIEDITDLFRRLKNSVSLLALFIFLLYLFINTGIMIWSLDWIPELMAEGETIIYVVLLVPVGLFKMTGQPFVYYFIFLVVAILSSLVVLFYKGTGDLVAYIKETVKSKGKNSDKRDSPIPRLAYIFMALTFVSYLYYMLLESAGSRPSTPGLEELPLWEFIYGLTRAAVWEELTVRLVFIGIPMFIYIYAKRKQIDWKYLYGGFGTKDRFVIVPVLLSSTIFAVAHLGGWDLYKLPPTFIAGLAFGYLYAKDGLHSAIILHFIWDYVSVPLRVTEIANADLIVGGLIMFWFVVGIYYLSFYTKKGIEWLVGKRRVKKEEPKVEEGPKIRVAGVTAAYVCPRCGNQKALYTGEGKLKCKRCGHISDVEFDASNRKIEKTDQGQIWPPNNR